MPTIAFACSRWRSARCLLAAGMSLLFLPTAPVVAQEPPAAGPLASLAKRLGTTKATAAKSAFAASSTKFTPSGKRIVISKMAESLADNTEEKKALTDLFEGALKSFEAETKKAGMANDVAPALAFFVQTHWSVYSGKEAPDAGSDKMIGQIRAILDTPEMAKSSDAEKQGFYEYCVCMSALTLTLYQTASQGDNKDGMANLRATAGKSLQSLLGVEPDKVAITATGLEISGTSADAIASAPPPSAGATKVTYTVPPNSRVEKLGGATILHRPKYEGTTRNENGTEQLYYSVLNPVSAASQPDREAAFEAAWKSLSDSMKINWPGRTLVHRFYMPGGAVCYVAIAGYRANETFGGYGECDGGRMTLCLLDFGKYYVPVAQVYLWTNGRDNLFYMESAFDAFVATIRVEGATTPRPYATKQQLIGDWAQTSSSYSSTDYVYRSSGAYAGNVTNVSTASTTLKLRADGTCRHEFVWYLNGALMHDNWDGTWTYDRGKVILKKKNGGKGEEFTLMYVGKHPKSGERFVALHRVYARDRPLTPMNAHSDDTRVYTPLK